MVATVLVMARSTILYRPVRATGRAAIYVGASDVINVRKAVRQRRFGKVLRAHPLELFGRNRIE